MFVFVLYMFVNCILSVVFPCWSDKLEVSPDICEKFHLNLLSAKGKHFKQLNRWVPKKIAKK